MQNHETRREDLLQLFSAKTTVSLTGDSVKVTACENYHGRHTEDKINTYKDMPRSDII